MAYKKLNEIFHISFHTRDNHTSRILALLESSLEHDEHHENLEHDLTLLLFYIHGMQDTAHSQ
jgi:hypothetical protein